MDWSTWVFTDHPQCIQQNRIHILSFLAGAVTDHIGSTISPSKTEFGICYYSWNDFVIALSFYCHLESV